jgi:hypothetical protein
VAVRVHPRAKVGRYRAPRGCGSPIRFWTSLSPRRQGRAPVVNVARTPNRRGGGCVTRSPPSPARGGGAPGWEGRWAGGHTCRVDAGRARYRRIRAAATRWALVDRALIDGGTVHAALGEYLVGRCDHGPALCMGEGRGRFMAHASRRCLEVVGAGRWLALRSVGAIG